MDSNKFFEILNTLRLSGGLKRTRQNFFLMAFIVEKWSQIQVREWIETIGLADYKSFSGKVV
jgi:hypothetical protein